MPDCRSESLTPVLSWMTENLAAEHTVASLARRAALSERTFARRFSADYRSTSRGSRDERLVASAPRE